MENELRVRLVWGDRWIGAPPGSTIHVEKQGNRTITQALTPKIGALLHPSPRERACVISAPTGAGKTYFLVHHLFPAALEQRMQILYVSNRVAVNLQQKQSLAKELGADELFDRLTFQGWQMQEDIGGIQVMTYQRLFSMLRDASEREMLSTIGLFVFDEVHALIHDALFVGTTGAVLAQIPEIFRTASRIYISATPDSVLSALSLAEGSYSDWLPVYSFYRSFRFVKPHFFTSTAQIAEHINADKSDQKWLIFVHSLRKMQDVAEKLHCEYAMLSAATRQESPDMWEKLLTTENFEEKVLICTSVIDSGVNFRDPRLTNIVSFSLDAEEIIQQMGRKRRTRKDESLSLYLCEPSLRTVTRRLFRLSELDDGLRQAEENPAAFLDQKILREDAPDFRRFCCVDEAGRLAINSLARAAITRQAEALQKLQSHGQRHEGDCGFAQTILRALRLPTQVSPSCWLDDRHSGTSLEGWLRFLEKNIAQQWTSPDAQQAFASDLRKHYTAAFGKRKSDRPERPWGATVINRVLAEQNTGLLLRSGDNGWRLEQCLEKERE